MKVLLTGGTGFVGSEVIKQLVAAGHEVRALIRPGSEKKLMLGSNALQPVSTATTVRVRSGKTQTTDGPFAETKEQLGGYYLLDCKDLDEAIEYAAKIPSGKIGSIEVRPVMLFD